MDNLKKIQDVVISIRVSTKRRTGRIIQVCLWILDESLGL